MQVPASNESIESVGSKVCRSYVVDRESKENRHIFIILACEFICTIWAFNLINWPSGWPVVRRERCWKLEIIIKMTRQQSTCSTKAAEFNYAKRKSWWSPSHNGSHNCVSNSTILIIQFSVTVKIYVHFTLSSFSPWESANLSWPRTNRYCDIYLYNSSDSLRRDMPDVVTFTSGVIYFAVIIRFNLS